MYYSSTKKDPLEAVVEENATSDKKEFKKPNSTLGRSGCNPMTETSGGGDSSSSSSLSFRGHWLEEDKIFPPKKRRIIYGSDQGNTAAEKTEQNKVNATAVGGKESNWKRVVSDDGSECELGPEMDDTLRRNKTLAGDGSQCKRSDGKGWRCSKPPVEGYSLCETHLQKTRAAYRLKVMKKHGSEASVNGQENIGIELPFPQPDYESCISSPRSRGSNLPIHAAQRCRRWNGKAWRCFETAVEGHSFCEHHLNGSKLWKRTNFKHKATSSPTAKSVKITVLDTGFDSDDDDSNIDSEKGQVPSKNRNVGLVKARSVSSLLGQKGSSSSRL